jgi:hypothetical protein
MPRPRHTGGPLFLGYLSAIYPAASAFFALPSQCSQPYAQLNPDDLKCRVAASDFLVFFIHFTQASPNSRRLGGLGIR